MSEGAANTEMEVIVKGMASIAILDEILKGADYKELIQNFRKDYNELDNLKVVRQACEPRSLGGDFGTRLSSWKKTILKSPS